MIRIAYTDWKTKTIRNKSIGVFLGVDLASIWMIPEIALWERITGMFVISVPLLLLTLIIPGGIGGGDIKLMAAGGFLLGRKYIWNAFVIGIVIAVIDVVYLMIRKYANRKTEIALGPFLCMGIICMLFKI